MKFSFVGLPSTSVPLDWKADRFHSRTIPVYRIFRHCFQYNLTPESQ